MAHAKVEPAPGADSSALWRQSLRDLLSRVPGYAAGIIVDASDPEHFRVLASHGLGAEPLRTLEGISGGLAMLEAAVRLGCWVTRSNEQVAWKTPMVAPSARSRWARATLQSGMAYPIAWQGTVLGVLAVYGTRAVSDRMGDIARSVAAPLARGLAPHLA